MNNFNKKYKDTFNYIKLEDKKINENLYKIIRMDNTKRKHIYRRTFFITCLLFVFALQVTAIVSNKLNGIKIKNKNNGEYVYSDSIFVLPDTIDNDYFGCSSNEKCSYKKIPLNKFEKDLNVNVLTPNTNNNYLIKPTMIYLEKNEIEKVTFELVNDNFVYDDEKCYTILYEMILKTKIDEEYEGNMVTGNNSKIIHNEKFDFDVVVYLDDDMARVYFDYDNITYTVFIDFKKEFINSSESDKYDLIERIVNNIE